MEATLSHGLGHGFMCCWQGLAANYCIVGHLDNDSGDSKVLAVHPRKRDCSAPSWYVALTFTWSLGPHRDRAAKHAVVHSLRRLLTNNQKTSEIKTSEAHIAALTSEIEQHDGSISSAENEASEITNAFAEATNNRDRSFLFSCSCNHRFGRASDRRIQFSCS